MVCVQDRASKNYESGQNYPSSPPSSIRPCKDDRAPSAYVLDVGHWTATGYFLGLVSGSTMVICRIMHSSDADITIGENKLINDVIAALKENNLSPSIKAHKFIKPWFDYEREYPDEILTSKDVLLVFIPDCHVGIRDEGDMFSPSGAPESCNHLIDTLETIRVAAKGKARIVQLGDFVEIWETEASPGIYYEWTGREEVYVQEGSYSRPIDINDFFMGPSGPVVYATIPEQTILIARAERSERAMERVRARWEGSRFAASPKLFDLMMPGNHDVERRWTKAQFYDLGEFKDCDRVRTGRRGSVVFEHGHILDEYNDTRPASSLENVIQVVPGKSVTYEYGRNKWGRGWHKPDPADDEDGNNLNDHWPSALQRYGVIDELGEFSILRSARKYTFQVFRENVIANGTKDPLKTDSSESYFVPVRLWVHAHTHVPSLRSLMLDKEEFNIRKSYNLSGQWFNSWPSLLNAERVISWNT
ncbi:hypothetical protein [Sorangium sp. So ce394]|uniref:hypothetical protein n=1 Tax=Sorangium sp. So ce394 TaxID=3133310 RepID=UPI003F5C694C